MPIVLSELDSLCKWLHGKAAKGEALRQLPPQQLTQVFHRGEAVTGVAFFTLHPPPPPSKPSYLEGVLKFDCKEAKPRQLWQISPVDPPLPNLHYLEGEQKFDCICNKS